MAADGIVLRGITWDHPRGVAPLELTAARWRERTGVEVRWEARSLRDFGDANVEGLARRYDLIVLDYPHMGAAREAGALVALDEQLDAAFLDDQAACAVGASHRSYQLGGHQWALAIDAAAQVSAARPDLLERVGAAWPASWADVEALCDVSLEAGRSAVAWPLAPADSVCSYLSLALDAGARIPAREGTLLERDSPHWPRACIPARSAATRSRSST
jgi:multiple sugar transport system substrate-binding protein